MAVLGLNDLGTSGMRIPARGGAALELLYDLVYFYYPLPLSNLVSVRCDRLLSKVRISRQAPTMLPWQAEANLHKSKVDGDCVRVANCRQSDSEDRRWSSRLDTLLGRYPIRQALQLFELLACNGERLSFGRATPVFFLGKENGGRITRHVCRRALRTCAKKKSRLSRDSSFLFYSLRKRSAMTAAASAVDSAPVSR